MLMYRDMATLTKHDVGCIAMTCLFNLYIYIQEGCKDNTLILTRGGVVFMQFVKLWGRTFDEVMDADKIRLDSPGFPSPMFEYFYVF